MIIGFAISGGEKKEFKLPDSWADVNRKQWIDILTLRSSCAARELPKESWIDPLTPQVELFLISYLDARKALGNLIPAMVEYLTPEVVETCINEMQWLRKLPDHYRSMRPSFGWIWKGPKDQLSNWTWKRYGLGEEAIRLYVSAIENENDKQKAIALRMLFAVLYAPFGIWNGRLADFYMWTARFVPTKWKIEALSNYQGLRTWLQQLYPRSFQGGSSDQGADSMRRLTVAMAGDKFGTVDMVGKASIHDVFIDQEMKAEEIDQLNNK